MSVLKLSESMDPSADLHIWNNAAFDNNGEVYEDLSGSRQSWGSLKSIFGNPKASFDSVSDKENMCVGTDCNQIPILSSSSSSPLKSSSTPFMPVNSDRAVDEKSRIEGFLKNGSGRKMVASGEIRDEKKIDGEIEEIENAIEKLKMRLEALRLEKGEMNAKALEKRGRTVPAKVMDPERGSKIAEGKKTIDEVSKVGSRPNPQRRGISLGPVEIISGARRGASVGPAEIFRATRSRQMVGRPEMATPVQSRRKSCFLKLQNIEEEKSASRATGKGFLSVSPNSIKVGLKSQTINSRQAVTTISSRKASKKDNSVMNMVQPKKLFRESEKVDHHTAGKKPSKPGRIVASRYNNQNLAQTTPSLRKRSLPENNNDSSHKFDSKRALSVGKTRTNVDESNISGIERSRVKKRWEIPSEIIVHGSVDAEKSHPSNIVLLPKIKIARCMKESPRDSGPAKKVIELIGRKSFFTSNYEEEGDPSLCQALTYAEEDEEVEELSQGLV